MSDPRPHASAPRPRKPRRWPAILAVLAVLAAITAWAWVGVGADVGDLLANAGNGLGTITQLLQPDYWFAPKTVRALLETVQMAIIATAVSALISLPLAFLASRTTNPTGTVRGAVRVALNVVRSVPDILYATILVAIVGVGALSGILALVVFNVGIIVKLISEALDSLDSGPLDAALAAGATWFKADRATMLPQILPTYAAQVLYTFELNIRASTVIGLVGAGGLGILIDNVRSFFRYHELSLILAEIVVIVLVLEACSAALRRRLV